MFRNVFRSPSTTTMLASAATAAFTGSSYISSSTNETKCEQKSNLPVFKGWRHRSDGTKNKTEMNCAARIIVFSLSCRHCDSVPRTKDSGLDNCFCNCYFDFLRCKSLLTIFSFFIHSHRFPFFYFASLAVFFSNHRKYCWSHLQLTHLRRW